MSEQLSFPGFERGPPNGLFFALVPPVASRLRIVNVIDRLRADVGLGGRPLSPRCLHISMHSLGAYSEPPNEIVAAACRAATEISASGFEMILDRALTFPRNDRTHPFVVLPGGEIAALMELHRALGREMARVGLNRWVDRRFKPHMTLSYDRQIIEERAVEAVRWPVNNLVLIYSLRGRGPGRNEHIHLARWPLR